MIIHLPVCPPSPYLLSMSYAPVSRAGYLATVRVYNSRKNKYGFCFQGKTSGGDWHDINKMLFLNVDSTYLKMLEVGLLYVLNIFPIEYTLGFERRKKFSNVWIYSQEITQALGQYMKHNVFRP